MSSNPSTEIYSSRIINAPVETVYAAFENPLHLQKWWGPDGFTNTFHEFNLISGGKWTLTMHGPEKGNYENESIFKSIIPFKLISWKRISQPHFDMEVCFKKLDAATTEISFKMIFETAEASNKIRNFAGPKNEENFDRLEAQLVTMKSPQ